QNLPPRRHRSGELGEEVLDPALTAAEVIEQNLPHDPPPQSRPPAQRRVDVGDADNTFANKVIHLSRQGSLEAIRDMPGHFLVQSYRPFSHSRVEFRDAPNRILGGLCATND